MPTGIAICRLRKESTRGSFWIRGHPPGRRDRVLEVIATEVVYPRCAGLDVHKRLVVACRIVPGERGQPAKELRSFGTTTRELLALADWLAAAVRVDQLLPAAHGDPGVARRVEVSDREVDLVVDRARR